MCIRDSPGCFPQLPRNRSLTTKERLDGPRSWRIRGNWGAVHRFARQSAESTHHPDRPVLDYLKNNPGLDGGTQSGRGSLVANDVLMPEAIAELNYVFTDGGRQYFPI